ncbi:MAG: hypothetical protein EAZ91_25270 [Cytophagales bacterium]|nr:MAG: hypothetical protein EAZ91_25270 [Cytophagales bacterium]
MGVANAQNTPASPDTLRPRANTDSVRVGNSIFSTDTALIDTLGATKLTKKEEIVRRKIIPRQATIRSLILPGLGQAYNRDFWKVPLVYAGIGTAIYFLIDNNGQYLKYERAYKEAYDETVAKTGDGKADVYVRSQGAILTLPVAPLKQQTDFFRRYRDLNVIIIVAVWALNAVEANVAAHLKTFDLSDDLTLRVQPNLLPTLNGVPAPGVRLTLNLKK